MIYSYLSFQGFLPPKGTEGQPFNPEIDTLIVITRDVFTWLSKMFDDSQDPIMNSKRKDGFSSFIRAPYTQSHAMMIIKRTMDSVRVQIISSNYEHRSTSSGYLIIPTMPLIQELRKIFYKVDSKSN